MNTLPVAHAHIRSFGPGQLFLLLTRLFFQRNAGLIAFIIGMLLGNLVWAGFIALIIPGMFWPMFAFGIGFDLYTMRRILVVR